MQDLTRNYFSNAQILESNPFGEDLFSLGTSTPSVAEIHRDELTECLIGIEQTLVAHRDKSTVRGEVLSITAPSAGYGKSHLIGRVIDARQNSLIVLSLTCAQKPSWPSLLAEVVDQLWINRRTLDRVAAHFLADIVTGAAQAMLKPGPEQEAIREEFSESILSPIERHATLDWLNDHLDDLETVKPAHRALTNIPYGDLVSWMHYFSAALRAKRGDASGFAQLDDESARRTLLQLLQICSVERPVLMVIDHMDACYGQAEAGLDIARISVDISENVSNSVLILSLNYDLWRSIFASKVPSAFADRINNERLQLSALTPPEARALVSGRLEQLGIENALANKFASRVEAVCDWSRDLQLHPRKVLRQAAEFWRQHRKEYLLEQSFAKNPSQTFPEPPAKTFSPYDTDRMSNYRSALDLPDAFNGQSNVYPDRNSGLSATVEEVTHYRQPTSTSADKKQPKAGGPQPPRQNTNSDPQMEHTGGAPSPKGNGVTTHPKKPFENPDAPSVRPSAGHFSTGALGPNPQIPITHGEGSTTPIQGYFDKVLDHYLAKKDRLGIDFPTIAKFIKTVGLDYPCLHQTEIDYGVQPGRLLKWQLPTHTIYIGLEPASHAEYYATAMKKMLRQPQGGHGKIICFTNPDSPFDPNEFLDEGMGCGVVQKHFDFVELQPDELALIYTGAQIMSDAARNGCKGIALKLVLKRMAPLWRRLCQPPQQHHAEQN